MPEDDTEIGRLVLELNPFWVRNTEMSMDEAVRYLVHYWLDRESREWREATGRDVDGLDIPF